MKRAKIFVLSILLLIAASVVSFYFGGKVGFHQGYFYCNAQQKIINAAVTTEVLLRIRDNKIDQTRSLLETVLDSQIIGHKFEIEKFQSFHGLYFYDREELLDEASIGIMKRACQYREKYPYKNDKRTGAVNQRIKSVLNHYLSNEN